ncbi:MAG TPA: SCP2 sterol-binding domain-containing protein [Thermoflexia bacterium]|jgi:putative sterol carrier protein|nr:SCP2 sterol-binding domain-containing protein [Thermoflexia bacterium]
MGVQEFFQRLAGLDPARLQGFSGVVLFDLSGEDGGKWTVTFSTDGIKVEEGETTTPDLTLSMDARDFLALSKGELSPMNAFMQGKLKVSGDMSMAMRLQNILT